MTQKEMNFRLRERSKALETRFAQTFDVCVIRERTCFVRGDGAVFAVDAILPFGALVLEYADSVEQAEQNIFEDGDLFYLEEIDEDAMYQSMLREING